MTLAPDHEQAIAYLLLEIRDLRVHLDRAEEHIMVITRENRTAHDKWVTAMLRIKELEAALREIAEHKHCTDPGDRPLNDIHQAVIWATECGHADGHRCCAEIARKALEK